VNAAGPRDASTVTVQYRVVVAKKDERVEGPDDADVVVTVPMDVAAADDFDATFEFMRGRLKSTGSTGALFDLLKSGRAQAELQAIAARG
jgi:hypothetical protein